MTLPAARRLLWITALATVPVPIWIFEPARVPVLWVAQISSYGVALWVSETASISVRVLAALGIVQTLAWAGVLYVVVRLVSRRLVPPAWRGIAVASLVTALVAAALLPIYRTTFIHDGVAVSWLGLFA
jgi:ABC-type proline/glycine betaine transport system permease subunit